MDIKNLESAKEWFEVLQTRKRCQTAIMTLKARDETGPTAEAHDESDQVLLVLEGELDGQVGNKRPKLKKGDVIIIPAGTKHRFVNRGPISTVTFNVYSPPAYPPGTKD